ncbi:hypothetical protein ACLVXC_002476 [Vibrio alginolyticus]|uniref:hypothetical protein n=1 Tax=Vibrio sp. EA2 TaxID=3079860 RepID=UPI00294A970E|nr:hypothetical protein [Vibrio sp. EA2]MDV6253610.1 hypothetical protein [Vibrio sp. EA2]
MRWKATEKDIFLVACTEWGIFELEVFWLSNNEVFKVKCVTGDPFPPILSLAKSIGGIHL